MPTTGVTIVQLNGSAHTRPSGVLYAQELLAAIDRTLLVVTLAADHRVADGHRGSAFLRAVVQDIERPEVP